MMFQTHNQAADMAFATPLEPKGRLAPIGIFSACARI
jgi:hypothetical protein